MIMNEAKLSAVKVVSAIKAKFLAYLDHTEST